MILLPPAFRVSLLQQVWVTVENIRHSVTTDRMFLLGMIVASDEWKDPRAIHKCEDYEWSWRCERRLIEYNEQCQWLMKD